jgi:hypothetical protein
MSPIVAVDRKGAFIAGKVRATLNRYGLLTQSEGIRANVTKMKNIFDNVWLPISCSIRLKYFIITTHSPKTILNNYSGL